MSDSKVKLKKKAIEIYDVSPTGTRTVHRCISKDDISSVELVRETYESIITIKTKGRHEYLIHFDRNEALVAGLEYDRILKTLGWWEDE